MRLSRIFKPVTAKSSFTGIYKIFKKENRSISIIAYNKDDALQQLNEHIRELKTRMPDITISDIRIK